MFSGYSEVRAYAHNEVPPELPVMVVVDKEKDYVRAEVLPSTSAFGGFKLWPNLKSDFILIAECSEISGPNPICTVPKVQRIVYDLNALCIRLLSADYQEFSSNKCITNNHTQVLMPDLMNDIHVAVNHFTLYDSEARGFVRPLCIAYITADKHKLMQLSEPIFKSLANAALIMQHTNRQFCQEGFRNLEMDLQLTKSNLSSLSGLQSSCDNPEERLKVYTNLIDSCIAAISEILDSIKSTGNSVQFENLIAKFSSSIATKFNENILSGNCSSEVSAYEPKLLKVPIQQNFAKHLRNLFAVSPNGSLVAFYHLYLTHKHFKRKYENIVLDNESKISENSHCLYYGACIECTFSPGQRSKLPDCINNLKVHPVVLDFCNQEYLSHLNDSFFGVFVDFLKSQDVDVQSLVQNGLDRFDIDLDDTLEESESKNSALNCDRHILLLHNIWEVIDYLKYEYPDAESISLRIFQAFDRAESILFTLLSQSLLVILYSVEEEFYVRVLLQVLALIIPTSKKNRVVISHNVGKAQKLKNYSNLSIVTYSTPCELSDVIPPDIMPLISVLDLTTASYCGPKYMGLLLDGVNEKVKRMTDMEPFFPFLISILGDIELQVRFWQSVVASSAANSFSTMYLLQKGYTRYDIKIVETLSRLCSS